MASTHRLWVRRPDGAWGVVSVGSRPALEKLAAAYRRGWGRAIPGLEAAVAPAGDRPGAVAEEE